MGAAASISEPIDKAAAHALLGDKFDEAQFDANAGEDGKVSVEKWAESPAPRSTLGQWSLS